MKRFQHFANTLRRMVRDLGADGKRPGPGALEDEELARVGTL
jgi:hypothetical protein